MVFIGFSCSHSSSSNESAVCSFPSEASELSDLHNTKFIQSLLTAKKKTYYSNTYELMNKAPYGLGFLGARSPASGSRGIERRGFVTTGASSSAGSRERELPASSRLAVSRSRLRVGCSSTTSSSSSSSESAGGRLDSDSSGASSSSGSGSPLS